MNGRKIQIAVIGAGKCSDAVSRLAQRIGSEVGRAGAVLICGGLGGVMEAAAKGAHTNGALTIGVLPSYDRTRANQWLDVVIPTGFGHGRNVIVVASGDAVIALPGEHGTASEVALALTLGRPVIALGAWAEYSGVMQARSPRQAVALAVAAASLR